MSDFKYNIINIDQWSILTNEKVIFKITFLYVNYRIVSLCWVSIVNSLNKRPWVLLLRKKSQDLYVFISVELVLIKRCVESHKVFWWFWVYIDVDHWRHRIREVVSWKVFRDFRSLRIWKWCVFCWVIYELVVIEIIVESSNNMNLRSCCICRCVFWIQNRSSLVQLKHWVWYFKCLSITRIKTGLSLTENNMNSTLYSRPNYHLVCLIIATT